MKMKSLKKVIASLMCGVLMFVSAPEMSASAALNDISQLGGPYGELIKKKREYLNKNPFDRKVYECHHLIAKEALNQWGKHIKTFRASNKFLLGDSDQNWAPSIIMEKADHEKTLSYYNTETRTPAQNDKAIKYIKKQADRIIKYGQLSEVLKEEINFIQKNLNFNRKYDRAISEVEDYIKKLQIRRISFTLVMRNPSYNLKWPFEFTFGK